MSLAAVVKEAPSGGVGVVAVIALRHARPANEKQDYPRSSSTTIISEFMTSKGTEGGGGELAARASHAMRPAPRTAHLPCCGQAVRDLRFDARIGACYVQAIWRSR